MKLLEALAVLVAVSAVRSFDIHPLSDEYIAIINQKAKTWKAGKNFELSEWERVKRISSGVLPFNYLSKKTLKSNPHNELEDVPESFDAREVYPNCDSIKQIRDQSSCGSCWAFSAVESMSDRICIHSNQTKQVYVSAENLIACCYGITSCGIGCQGGLLVQPWEYWQSTGIVTGGSYNSSQGCQDYSMQPCDQEGSTGTKPQCSDLKYDTPACIKTCYNTSLNYNDSLTFGQDVFTFTNAKQMQLEIYKNGPVQAGLIIYWDFMSYKSGVYQHTTDDASGRHAIKIIGWGVEDGTPYWLCANSFNTDWGDEGFFKILRGENHCNIETDVTASLPLL